MKIYGVLSVEFHLFDITKIKIKRERLRSVILNQDVDLDAVIKKSFMEIKKDVCVNFINKSN